MIPSLRYFAIAGVLIVVVFSAIAALQYRGKRGERYSPLNHFVSELGELSISSAARLFNLGLVLGGLLLLPFLINLGWIFNSWLGWLGTLAGVIAALALAGVGIYPMDNLEKHALAAMTYFRAGLAMVFFFGLAIHFQPDNRLVVPRSANLLSLLAFASYASFLSLTGRKSSEEELEALDPANQKERPRIWLLSVVEWLLFAATVSWILGLAVIL